MSVQVGWWVALAMEEPMGHNKNDPIYYIHKPAEGEGDLVSLVRCGRPYLLRSPTHQM